jgi:hypothetical protein
MVRASGALRIIRRIHQGAPVSLPEAR